MRRSSRTPSIPIVALILLFAGLLAWSATPTPAWAQEDPPTEEPAEDPEEKPDPATKPAPNPDAKPAPSPDPKPGEEPAEDPKPIPEPDPAAETVPDPVEPAAETKPKIQLPTPPSVISVETFESSSLNDLEAYLRPFTLEEVEEVALWAQRVVRERAMATAHEKIWYDTKAEDEKDAALKVMLEAIAREEDALDRLKLAIEILEEKGGDGANLHAYVKSLSILQLDDTTGELITAWLSWHEGGGKMLGTVLLVLVYLIASWLFSVVCGFLAHIVVKHLLRKSADLIRNFVVGAVRNTVLIGMIMAGLQAIGVDIAHMLAAAGIAGFVLAFALQGILANFAAGVMLLIYRPFDVGDFIEAAGVAGTVRQLRMVSTELASIDNELLVVPNGKLWGDVIRNKSGNTTRRIDLVFRVALDSDVDHVIQVLRDVVGEEKRLLPEPAPNICVGQISEFAIDVLCRPWVNTPEYWGTRWSLTRAIYERLKAEGIKIPVPQRELVIHRAEDKAD